MPTQVTMVRFLTACGVEVAAQEPWLAAWERVRTERLPGAGRVRDGAVWVRAAKPRLLGVHASIRVDDQAPELPPYVTRDVDREVRAELAAAERDGGFIVLSGPRR